MSAHRQISELKRRPQLSTISQETVGRAVIIGLLANGNLLVEGYPICHVHAIAEETPQDRN